MKRKLFKQICSEWRSNIWLGIELIIIGFILSALVGQLINYYNAFSKPTHYNLDDVITAQWGEIPTDSPSFTPYDTAHSYLTDAELILNQIRNNPFIEAVGVGDNALPYTWNFYGTTFVGIVNGDTLRYGSNLRSMSPDGARALRLTGINGETPEEIARLLDEGKMIMSIYDTKDEDLLPKNKEFGKLRGNLFYNQYDSTEVYEVGAIIEPISRNDFEHQGMVTVIKPYKTGTRMPGSIIIRAKEGQSRRFIETVSQSDIVGGNVYLQNMITMESQRETAQSEFYRKIRNQIVISLFLLVIIFLGFLGTFWFKTQQRIPEMALRKSCGASNGSIFRRLISEGLIVLAASMIVLAITTYVVLFHTDLIPEDMNFKSTAWFCLTITGLLMALIIIAGIWAPAYRAMRIQPAIALKEQ